MTSPGAPVLNAAFVTTALGGRLRSRAGSAPDSTRFRGAAIDSRAVQPDDLFVALPGDRVDGHSFAPYAVEAGATGCLLTHDVRDVERAGPVALFLVDDTLAALQLLGARWREALTGTQVIGITGSVGKTTTKAIVASVLATKYRVQANPLNYNNEVSVPLCLLELRPETERAVIEHGMYTTGEIALLCTWTRPRIGVVLNVGPTHLERAGSIETITRAKRELVEALPADGAAVLNADDERVRSMAEHTEARVWWFGTSGDAQVRGTDVASDGARGFDFTLNYDGSERRVHVPLPGRHLLSNVLAAAATALADGMSLDEVASAIEALDVPLRLNVIEMPGGITVLDDTYNAQPASTIAALDLLEEMSGRHVALLGDMRELGEVSRAEHERVGRRAAEVVALLITIGDEARALGEAARAAGLADTFHVASRDEAIEALHARLAPGDVVLIKGSHALALEHVVEALAGASENGGVR